MAQMIRCILLSWIGVIALHAMCSRAEVTTETLESRTVKEEEATMLEFVGDEQERPSREIGTIITVIQQAIRTIITDIFVEVLSAIKSFIKSLKSNFISKLQSFPFFDIIGGIFNGFTGTLLDFTPEIYLDTEAEPVEVETVIQPVEVDIEPVGVQLYRNPVYSLHTLLNAP